MGWRMARTTRGELRPGPGLCGWRRLKHNSGGGWGYGVVDHVDSGPRRRKFSAEGMPAALPGHNVVVVLLGCVFAWIGWMALNSAGAILFLRVESGRVVLIAVNTTLCAAASGLTAAVVTRVRFGRPDASLSANGWIAGLVASSAAAALLEAGSGHDCRRRGGNPGGLGRGFFGVPTRD